MSGADTGVLARYRAIVEHAELELEHAGRGDLAALEEMSGHWGELIEGLPTWPPAEAGPLLQRAVMMHERTRIELTRLGEGLLMDLSTARRARRTADGYAGHLPRRPRLDRSA